MTSPYLADQILLPFSFRDLIGDVPIMKIYTLEELKLMADKADEYANRYDIAEQVYRDLLDEYQKHLEYIQQDQELYSSPEDWNAAVCSNQFIVICLLIRLNEMCGAYDE